MWLPNTVNSGSQAAGAGDSSEEQKLPRLVSHVFSSTPSGQLPALWHNRIVHPLPTAVAVECLFTRFALTILSPSIFNTFLPSTSAPRRLLLWNGKKDEYEIEEASPEVCSKLWKNAQSRSPQMRSANDITNNLLLEEMPSLRDSTYLRTNISREGNRYGAQPRSAAQGEKRRPRKRRRDMEVEDFEESDRPRMKREVPLTPSI
ncbi:hypothetical protein O1611_g5284 [Lasiodiplodia mahajangana]|uniref:Uncharacterized protein n=1 Tax=Lasiodiplodia mahajangana TaxID=1108764 RepID=A0ACC2JLR2_9PEZI|nr:hypothetical protein O1611_g5284 [Lasiodiplodia mahajangana]